MKSFSVAFCDFSYSDPRFHKSSEFISEGRKSLFSPFPPLRLVRVTGAVLAMFGRHKRVTVFKELSSGERCQLCKAVFLEHLCVWLWRSLGSVGPPWDMCVKLTGCCPEIKIKKVFWQRRNCGWEGAAQHFSAACAAKSCDDSRRL